MVTTQGKDMFGNVLSTHAGSESANKLITYYRNKEYKKLNRADRRKLARGKK